LRQNSQQFELGSNYCHSTLAASAEIIIFLEILKFSKKKFLKKKNFMKENEESLRIFQCSEMETSKSINYSADKFLIVPSSHLHVYVFLCHVWMGMIQCGKAMPSITND
jgi:hypothetical protein